MDEADWQGVCNSVLAMDRQETILMVKSRGGESFTLIALASGGYKIAREGKFVDDREWSPSEVKECTQALVRIAGLDRLDGEHPS
jgi:hypothetical protein